MSEAKSKRAARKEPAPPASPTPPDKEPFDIERAVPLLREAVAPYPKAALFELAARGHDSVFEILAACIISIRTRVATVSTQPHLLAPASVLGHAGVN